VRRTIDCRSDLAEPCGGVTTDEAASGGWPAVQHFAPMRGPGLPVRSRGRRMVGLKTRHGQARRARSKILLGHDCAGVWPHGTALLLAKAEGHAIAPEDFASLLLEIGVRRGSRCPEVEIL